MSIAASPLAGAAVSQPGRPANNVKTPPGRKRAAIADQTQIPEPR